MLKKDIIHDLNHCAIEAEILGLDITTDKYCDATLYIDNQDRIYLEDELTPYCCADVRSIKYHFSEEYSEGSYVKINFKNDDILSFHADGEASASFKRGIHRKNRFFCRRIEA